MKDSSTKSLEAKVFGSIKSYTHSRARVCVFVFVLVEVRGKLEGLDYL